MDFVGATVSQHGWVCCYSLPLRPVLLPSSLTPFHTDPTGLATGVCSDGVTVQFEAALAVCSIAVVIAFPLTAY